MLIDFETNALRRERPRRTRKACGVALAILLSCLGTNVSAAEADTATEAVIRLLPTRDPVVAGKTLIEALPIDPTIHSVAFYVDGERQSVARFPPWDAKLNLASPAREQRVRVEALDGSERVLGSDEMIVNRAVARLRVEITSIGRVEGAIEVEARVQLPLEVELERLVFYLNESPQKSFRGGTQSGPIRAEIPYSEGNESDFVRAVAYLADGRFVEDVELIHGATIQEEIDVHLVQLQVLVTNKQGDPLKGLRKEHFQIRDRGKRRDPAGLFIADDVSLLLGLAVDSSGSMRSVWPQTRSAAERFLESTLVDRDEGFLVDFDTRLHLVEPRTGDLGALRAGLATLEPDGGTALYDSILYSLVQFDRQQGRRALVVITDGFDIDSQADPKRTIEFGKKLGVPIYIIAMENESTGRSGPRLGAVRGGVGMRAGGLGGNRGAVHTLHVVTEPTGGRMFRARTTEQLSRAFAQINSDLRSHYVLTYYTDSPPEPGSPPEVDVVLEGFKNLEITTVLGADQIY